MKNTNRLIGGILLVSGTSIGAGMLALPVISSFGGFFPSLLFLAICWFFLLMTAWFLLDVNLAFRGEVNMVSMAGRTLGTWGRAICWAAYLLLLYSLISAYIAGGSPLFVQAFSYLTGWELPDWAGPFPMLLLFGLFVYFGTRSVDWINRLLMAGLIISYSLLVFFLPPHVQFSYLQHVDTKAIWVVVPVLFTSFGFHIIIPTLTTYLDHNVKQLRLTILIGSLIPFLVYAIWEFMILGVVPLEGPYGLIAAWTAGQSGVYSLSHLLQNSWIASISEAFSFFAIITSFLGVSLSLSDFLTDGLHMKRFSFGREFASLLTFVPPLLFVLTSPRVFIVALQYAGIFVAILLCILPALMAWKLPSYQTFFRKSVLVFVILVSLFVIGLDILEEAGILKNLIDAYVPAQG